MAELTCPKCQSPMRTYERNNVTVDQCTGCSGLFLDRGELERLMQAEDARYGGLGGDPQGGRRGFLEGLLGGHRGRRGHH